jgi:hypothetical protein
MICCVSIRCFVKYVMINKAKNINIRYTQDDIILIGFVTNDVVLIIMNYQNEKKTKTSVSNIKRIFSQYKGIYNN